VKPVNEALNGDGGSQRLAPLFGGNLGVELEARNDNPWAAAP